MFHEDILLISNRKYTNHISMESLFIQLSGEKITLMTGFVVLAHVEIDLKVNII